MHHQASFIPAFFPEGTEVGDDADFFYFPAYADKDLGKPVLGAGTLWAITKDSPGAQALIEFLKSPIAHEVWMAQKGFLTPLKASTRMSSADPDAQEDERHPSWRHHLPLRRVRPDARRRRRRLLLDRHGRLHRRQAAEEVADEIQKSWDALK
jgi:alpha-glucoside transport system substrate-binding protein